MASLPKACRKQHCAAKTTNSHGYCDAHKDLASWGRYQQQRGKSPYNNGKWRKVREAIMMRDQGLCQECKRNGKVKAGVDCDHVTPVARGGNMWSYSNLQMLCRQCHINKTGRE